MKRELPKSDGIRVDLERAEALVKSGDIQELYNSYLRAADRITELETSLQTLAECFSWQPQGKHAETPCSATERVATKAIDLATRVVEAFAREEAARLTDVASTQPRASPSGG